MSPSRSLALAAFLCPFLALVGLAFLTAACTASPGAEGPASPRAPLPLETLAGKPAHPLLEAERPAVCLLLVRTDCPISNRYAPEVRRLAEAFADTAEFWLVYCDPGETTEQIEAHRVAYGYPFPALRDPELRVARSLDARVTPEVAVFNARRELVYVGRIDDRHVDFGKTRTAPTVRDLEQLLAALAAGDEPELRRTEAVGCPLPELVR